MLIHLSNFINCVKNTVVLNTEVYRLLQHTQKVQNCTQHCLALVNTQVYGVWCLMEHQFENGAETSVGVVRVSLHLWIIDE